MALARAPLARASALRADPADVEIAIPVHDNASVDRTWAITIGSRLRRGSITIGGQSMYDRSKAAS